MPMGQGSLLIGNGDSELEASVGNLSVSGDYGQSRSAAYESKSVSPLPQTSAHHR